MRGDDREPRRARRGRRACAWLGWLYTGSAPVSCRGPAALVAALASVDPALRGGAAGEDSPELQALQARLLTAALELAPEAFYPAALCALTDVRKVAQQDALDTALAARDAGRVAAALESRDGDAAALFVRAAARAVPAGAAGAGAGRLWYPYSFTAALYARRAAFLLGCAAALPAGAAAHLAAAAAATRAGLDWAAAGAGVLAGH